MAGRPTAPFTLGLAVLTWTSCGFPQVYPARCTGSGRRRRWCSGCWCRSSCSRADPSARPSLRRPRRPGGARAAVPAGTSARQPAGRVRRSSRCCPPSLFFGPLPAWAIGRRSPVGCCSSVLLALGALMVLPLVGPATRRARWRSAWPGDRLVRTGSRRAARHASCGCTTPWRRRGSHDRRQHCWTPAGVARPAHRRRDPVVCRREIIDLPFLVLVYRRWLRADARDAQRVSTPCSRPSA